MRPEISLASHVSTHHAIPSAFTEAADNNAIDFQGMTDKVQAKVEEVVQETGEMKRLFNGFLDDVFGAKKSGTA
jgi:hypothetical protein